MWAFFFFFKFAIYIFIFYLIFITYYLHNESCDFSHCTDANTDNPCHKYKIEMKFWKHILWMIKMKTRVEKEGGKTDMEILASI